MKLWERLSENIFRLAALPYLHTFEFCSPERILSQSMKLLDPVAVNGLKKYVKENQTPSGGFSDRAGKADLYYTLFGLFVAEALEIKEIPPSVRSYVESSDMNSNLTGVHLQCAAILSAKLSRDQKYLRSFRDRVQDHFARLDKQHAYSAFLNLLTFYYLKDYKSLYKIKTQLREFASHSELPVTVISALLVLQRSFNRPADDLIKDVFSFYTGKGSFRATHFASLPDLLSTAVALYALRFAGADLRRIKPDCLEFVDSLHTEGGFGGNIIDNEPDIEYTFYGLLALGSLAG